MNHATHLQTTCSVLSGCTVSSSVCVVFVHAIGHIGHNVGENVLVVVHIVP